MGDIVESAFFDATRGEPVLMLLYLQGFASSEALTRTPRPVGVHHSSPLLHTSSSHSSS